MMKFCFIFFPPSSLAFPHFDFFFSSFLYFIIYFCSFFYFLLFFLYFSSWSLFSLKYLSSFLYFIFILLSLIAFFPHPPFIHPLSFIFCSCSFPALTNFSLLAIPLVPFFRTTTKTSPKQIRWLDLA